VHVRGEDDVDARVGLRDQDVLGEPELGDEDHEVDAVVPERRDVTGNLVGVTRERDALRDPGAERVDGAFAGQADETDAQARDREDARGREEELLRSRVVDVRRESAPARPGGEGGALVSRARAEEFEEAVLAVQVVPVAGGEHVDAEAVHDVHEGLAAREEGLGAALDGVPGVDEDGVRSLAADALDEGGHPREAALRSAGAVAAHVGAGDEVAVQVSDVDEGEIGHFAMMSHLWTNGPRRDTMG